VNLSFENKVALVMGAGSGMGLAAAMTHIAIQEKKGGKVVDWVEQVSEEHYRAD
jgi:NAD(P)-dependent dehydrogenase (short-subunit alcohol dehydrogenase family)